MDLLGAPLRPSPMRLAAGPVPIAAASAPGAPVITIAPDFAGNRPPVSSCPGPSAEGCRDLLPQGANFVPLHVSPRGDSPLVSDPSLHPDGAAGTTRADDWGATAAAGSQFVVAGRIGDWTGIFFGGRVAWFLDPVEHPVSVPAIAPAVVTPRPGLDVVPVYGGAYPEAGAYPADIPVQPVAPLQYTIGRGQWYVAQGRIDAPDYYYAKTYDSSLPHDHTDVVGTDAYYLVQLNHRWAYVRAADVTAVPTAAPG
jgi:hypothetical protein